MLAAADCELLGRQVGNGTATDDVEDTEVYVDVVSVMPKGKNRYYNLKGIKGDVSVDVFRRQ